MKTIIPLLLSLMFLVGCTEEREVDKIISRGELISVDFLGQPYPQYSPHSLGWSTHKGGEVRIYEEFIIITTPNGESALALHNWYKNLRYKEL